MSSAVCVELSTGQPEEAMAVEKRDIEEEAPIDWGVIVGGGVSLFPLVLLLKRLQHLLSSPERSPGLEAVEADLFLEFERVARRGAPQATFTAFVTWLDHLSADDKPVSAGQVLERAQDEKLAKQYEVLVQGLYGSPTPTTKSGWSGSEFSKAVRRGRRSFHAGDAKRRGPQDLLPPLNPEAA
jgi:hypothetical protein